MVDTFSPSIAPSYGSTNISEEPKVLIAGFGDGYTQRAADGLNSIQTKGTLSFDSLTLDQANEIILFCRAKKAVTPFYYSLPDESSPGLFRCTKWQKTWKGPNYYQVNMTIEQVFDQV